MTTSIRPGRFALALSLALVAIMAGACASAAPQSPGPSGTPVADPSPSGPAGAVLDTDALIAAGADLDGTVVRVKGFFLAADGIARLCSAVLESYPPQCGGGTVRLTGEVPADVLDALDRTTEPDLAQATWGWVVVEGTFRAKGATGAPTIELTRVELAEV